MNSTLKSALAFSAIAVGTAGLSAAIGLRENACPAPAATSVEALFAPCLAQTANATQPLPADLPEFLARPGVDARSRIRADTTGQRSTGHRQGARRHRIDGLGRS